MTKQIVNGSKVIVNGRKVGTVQAETFYKEIRGSKHIMRSPHAIFFDIASLREVESYGAKFIHITDKETGDIYTASLSDVWHYGIEKNYGFNPQVGLAVNRWTVTHKGGTHGGGSNIGGVTGYESPTEISFIEYEKRHPTKAEKQAGQLSLFGGRG